MLLFFTMFGLQILCCWSDLSWIYVCKDSKIFFKIEKLGHNVLHMLCTNCTSSNNVCKRNNEKIVLFHSPLNMVSLGRHCEILFSFGLNAPKCDIFDCSDCHDFYTMKSPRVGDFGFKIFIFHICKLIRIYMLWPLSVCWANASGTDACSEHTHQSVMCALSIRVRNVCLHCRLCIGYLWINLAKIPSNMPSIRVRNWCCVHGAYA